MSGSGETADVGLTQISVITKDSTPGGSRVAHTGLKPYTKAVARQQDSLAESDQSEPLLKTGQITFMISECSFTPPWYLRNPHLQTILANIVHPPTPKVRLETIYLSDGDQLQLAHGSARGRHAVLILHGLEGSLRSSYAQRLLHALNRAQIPAVFMYFRGCDGQPNQKLRSYHSGETGDLREVIHHLRQQGVERLALVGYSLGGNVTLKYLGEDAIDDSVSCAIAVSVPMLLDECARRMNLGFSRLYQRVLLNRLKEKVQQKKHMLANAGYPTETSQINTFEHFDDIYTAPLHGFDSAQHYYRSCSSRQFLGRISTPTLIIQSLDDPFMTDAVIPTDEELSAQVALELADFGGHVGFLGGGKLLPQFWLESRILKQVRQFL